MTSWYPPPSVQNMFSRKRNPVFNASPFQNFSFRPGRPVSFDPRRSRRAGVAMLELAIVLPIFLLLVLGIIEMGRVMMLNQMATNGCREACRRAIVPGADHNNVLNVVNGYLDASGVKKTGRVVGIRNSSGSVVNLSTINSHESVTVRVEFPYSENTWGFSSIMGGKKLISQSTMRRE
jgi:Flp pilus assembly protein TadG